MLVLKASRSVQSQVSRPLAGGLQKPSSGQEMSSKLGFCSVTTAKNQDPPDEFRYKFGQGLDPLLNPELSVPDRFW